MSPEQVVDTDKMIIWDIHECNRLDQVDDENGGVCEDMGGQEGEENHEDDKYLRRKMVLSY
jgi:hypothetical protein